MSKIFYFHVLLHINTKWLFFVSFLHLATVDVLTLLIGHLRQHFPVFPSRNSAGEGEKWPAQDIPGHMRLSLNSKRISRGQHRYSADANWGVLMGVQLRHLANTTESSVCGGDTRMSDYVDHFLISCFSLQLVICILLFLLCNISGLWCADVPLRTYLLSRSSDVSRRLSLCG